MKQPCHFFQARHQLLLCLLHVSLFQLWHLCKRLLFLVSVDNLLLSFFGRSFRFPFVREKGGNILKKDALEYFDEQLKTIYFDQFVNEINDKNIYSAYLSLYESFHWQSADVSSQAFGMFDHQLRIVHPFKDDKIIKLLMQTPERFGRGLDLNRTKFGLKKFLKNKDKK